MEYDKAFFKVMFEWQHDKIPVQFIVVIIHINLCIHTHLHYLHICVKELVHN